MKIGFFIAAGLCAICTSVFAEDNFYPHQIEALVGVSHANHSFSSLHLGSGATEEVDTLHSTSSNNDLTWGFGYGYNILPWFVSYQQPDPHRFLQHVLLGVDLLFFNTTDSGDVYQDKNPDMNNFTYAFDVDTTRLMLNSEIDFKSFWPMVFPYLQASVGAARIESHYHDKPQIPGIGGGITLDEHTDYNVAYSIGAGIKYYIAPYFQLSLSYLYTGLGEVESDNNALEDHLDTSSGLFGFTYLFQ